MNFAEFKARSSSVYPKRGNYLVKYDSQDSMNAFEMQEIRCYTYYS